MIKSEERIDEQTGRRDEEIVAFCSFANASENVVGFTVHGLVLRQCEESSLLFAVP